MRSLTRDEMRRVDRYAIDTLGIPGLVLMENAGRRCADVIQGLLARRGWRSVAVVAGGGNNGGDGFVLARHLSLRGFNVATFLIAPPDKVSGDAAVNLAALRMLEQDLREVDDAAMAGLADELAGFDVVVDAIGGTGISGALRGTLASAAEAVNAAGRPVVSVDIPTGLDCDTGEVAGPAVRAVQTVTMLARKRGFDADGADAYTGQVAVVDIGIPSEWVSRRADVSAD